MIRNTMIGAGLWLLIAVAGRISAKLERRWIELFLFAALVIVPLGLELTMRLDGGVPSSRLEIKER